MLAKCWICTSVIWVFLLGGSQEPTANCQPTRTDPYSVDLVNSAFHFFRDSKGGFEGEAKRFVYPTPSLPELGDDVSIAILKILKPAELIEPENAYAYLTLVTFAFSYSHRVLQEADREPKITLFLLDFLQEKEISDPRLEKRIELIKNCVRDFSCRSATGDENHSR
jgi:hypothetical protein